MKQMAKNFIYYLNIWKYNIFLNVKTHSIYNINFILNIIIDLSGIITSLFFYKILYLNVSEVFKSSGWELHKIYILIITVKIINDLYAIFFSDNLNNFCRGVWDGTFDYELSKPLNIFYLVAFQTINIWSLTNLVISFGLLILVWLQYQLSIASVELILYFLSIIIAVGVRFSFSFFIIQVAIYFKRIDAFMAFFHSFFTLSQVPDIVFKAKWVRILFTYFLPVFLIGNLPLKILYSQLNWLTVSELFCFTIFLFFISYMAFKTTLRRYSSVGS